jgi:hypothetical protein
VNVTYLRNSFKQGHLDNLVLLDTNHVRRSLGSRFEQSLGGLDTLQGGLCVRNFFTPASLAILSLFMLPPLFRLPPPFRLPSLSRLPSLFDLSALLKLFGHCSSCLPCSSSSIFKLSSLSKHPCCLPLSPPIHPVFSYPSFTHLTEDIPRYGQKHKACHPAACDPASSHAYPVPDDPPAHP